MLILPVSTLTTSFEEKIKIVFNISADEITRRLSFNLEQRATEIENHIKNDAIDSHQLTPIILAALSSITKNAAAIDALNINQASLLHVRHIEELVTILQYLISKPDEYDKFSWKWKNFSMTNGIRSILLRNPKTPMEPALQDWINREIGNLKKYINSKITTDCSNPKSLEVWKKYSNWLYPITLRDIFEKTSRDESYFSGTYDWNSHSVHFSPIADELISLKLKHYAYDEFSTLCTLNSIDILYKECWVIVAHPERIRKAQTLNTFIDTYKQLRSKPEWFLEMIRHSYTYSRIAKYILDSDNTLESAIKLIAGKEKPDPLSIKPTSR